MGVQNELFGSAFVEVDIALRRIFQRNDCGVDRFSNLYLVVKDCHHQLAMVAHDRRLTGREGKGLGPAQTDAHTQLTDLRIFVDAAWIASYIQARNTYSPCSACDTHHIIEHCRRSFCCSSAMSASLEADTVNGCIHHRLPDYLRNHIGQFGILRKVDGLTTEAACLCKPVLVHVTDDDDCRAKQL